MSDESGFDHGDTRGRSYCFTAKTALNSFTFHLIIMKIIPIVATRYQILGLKCIKFDFGLGSSAPDPAGGAYSAPQTP